MTQILKAVEKEGKMLVTVKGFGHTPRTRLVDCTLAEFKEWRETRKYIQDAMPTTSANDREFLISGMTPEEWDEMFARGEDD